MQRRSVLETVQFVTPVLIPPPCDQPPCPKVPQLTPQAAEQCCAACLKHKRCKAWIVDGHRCSLVGDVNTDYPTAKSRIISGYPLSSDPASYCANLWLPRGHGKGWADTTIELEVSCAVLKANTGNVSSCPRAWTPYKHRDSSQDCTFPPCPVNPTPPADSRGDAWFFPF
eukprot:SAG31_NODE_1872_length_7025_cov_3.574069_4_plen_170_part_00